MKKEYKAPIVDRLGSAAEDTKSGSSTGSDNDRFRQSGGFPPPADQPMAS